MEEAKRAAHTPGPWMVLPSVSEGQFAILTEHGPRQDVACTYGWESTPREANARLIAAAPDLLEALIEMAREKADYMTRNNLGDPAKEHTNKMAAAAIAKALWARA
jgi:hypothetical protein